MFFVSCWKKTDPIFRIGYSQYRGFLQHRSFCCGEIFADSSWRRYWSLACYGCRVCRSFMSWSLLDVSCLSLTNSCCPCASTVNWLVRYRLRTICFTLIQLPRSVNTSSRGLYQLLTAFSWMWSVRDALTCETLSVLGCRYLTCRLCSTTVFSHAQSVVLCGNCNQVLCQPTGGKARLMEGCSFRKKVE